jgi:hypothetical protein
MVALQPLEPSFQLPAFKRQGSSDRYGHLEITGVRPGSYSVAAQAMRVNGTELEALSPVQVTVSADEVVTVNLRRVN